jgi:hypothetical protein
MPLDLADPRIDRLVSLIKDSFRVRPNQDPVYVDIGGNLERVASQQHQVIFGRRGSGKSCLLVHFHRRIASDRGILSIYVDADEIKRLGYPDVLIRLLLSITEQLPTKRRGPWAWARRKPKPLLVQATELRQLLDLAEESEVTEEQQQTNDSQTEIAIKQGPIAIGAGEGSSTSFGRTSSFRAAKLDALERHFQDYKRVIGDSVKDSGHASGALIIDDFYLFHQSVQPDILDYLHRLLRGTDLYLKLGTVRHRTTLMRYEGQAIGVELGQDVEEISLDRTFEDVRSTQEFLGLMLDELCKKVEIEAGSEFISTDGLLALTLASGGVPRDYLNTLVEGIAAARGLGQQRVTPRTVYRGAGRLSYRTKLGNLRDDVAGDASAIERVFADLAVFCLKEERKTGFLVSQAEVGTHEAEHEVIQQLMDFKLIHVIEPDTSAASGRTGRFEAYTLDFALFMEPRLRGIAHIEFWKTDDQRRRKGVREAPAYSLERARDVMLIDSGEATESIIEGIEEVVGTEPSQAGDAGD